MNNSKLEDLGAKTETRRKRVITDARKEQNRLAAKAYRQRQKESLQDSKKRDRRREGRYHVLKPRESCVLRENISAPVQPAPCSLWPAEDMTTTGLLTGSDSLQVEPLSNPNGQIGSGHMFQSYIFQDENLSLNNHVVSQTAFPSASEYENSSLSLPFSTPGSSNPLVDSVYSDTTLGCPTGIIHGADSGQVGISSTPISTPTLAWVQTSASHQLSFLSRSQLRISETSGNQDSPTEGAVNQSLEVLEDISSPERSSATSRSFDIGSLDISISSLPDLHINYILLSSVATVNALLRNAVCLGIKLPDLMTSQYRSPFYRLTSPSDNPRDLLAAAYIPSAPPHLQPTLPQILFPHHSYLDLIPFPVLRARVIALAATFPQLFNPIDVKMDIIGGGLACWRERSKIELGNGNGQPWDMRSWEAAPWFLKKWRILIDGEDGEMWKQSSWWQKARERGDLPAPSNYKSFACG